MARPLTEQEKVKIDVNFWTAFLQTYRGDPYKAGNLAAYKAGHLAGLIEIRGRCANDTFKVKIFHFLVNFTKGGRVRH